MNIDFTEIEMPEWATSDEAKAFFLGLVFAVAVKLIRSLLRIALRALNPGDAHE